MEYPYSCTLIWHLILNPKSSRKSADFGINKTRTTPRRPQSDGMVERANRTIQNLIASYISDKQDDWDEHIPLLMLAYRSSFHETTGVSPAAMVFDVT